MRCTCGTRIEPGADWCHRCLTPAGRVRLINEAAKAAHSTPTEAEQHLRRAEKVVYRTTRVEGSSTSFGLFGRVVGSVVTLAPGLALTVYAFLRRDDPLTAALVVFGVVPALAVAAMLVRDLWKPTTKAERVLAAHKLESLQP